MHRAIVSHVLKLFLRWKFSEFIMDSRSVLFSLH